MHIVVKSKDVEIKRGNSGRTGRPYEILEQTAFLHTGDEIRRLVVPLRSGQSPYAPGNYGIDPDSFSVDQFGGLTVRRLALAPLPSAAAVPSQKVG